jgi:hypothetical protein
MHFRSIAIAAALLVSLLPGLATAQEAPVVERVTFKNGRATIARSVKGYATHDYVFPAGAGESISVALKSGKAFVNVNQPGSEEAIFNGSIAGSRFEGAAPVAGDYTARVYLMRNEARRGTSAKYTLTIAVGATQASNEKGPDFADGLTGGPDYWEVTGVSAGDSLSLRATPAPKGKIVARLANGALVKNLGCKNTKGSRWCRVSDESGARGWANGRFLRESGGPAH